jgi:hypothetical protein
VLSSQKRLASEQARAARITEKANELVALRQDEVDDAVIDLIAGSGLARSAALLGRSENAMARVARSRRRARGASSRPAAEPARPARTDGQVGG